MSAFRFQVVTSSVIESGTTIAYLIEKAGLPVEKIYFDTMRTFSRKKAAPELPKPRWFSDWSAFRQHLGLSWSMPRHYLFKALRQLFGVSEMGLLFALERITPRLLPWACGFPTPEKAAGRPLLRKLPDVAKEYGIPLVCTPSLNSDETISSLTNDAPDVVIGLQTRILSHRLLATAKIGFLNAHSSLLPEYRGGATEFWQLAAGERETGVTIHWMTANVDEGPICAQERWKIPRGFDHHRLRLMSFFNRLDLWREVVEELMKGEVVRLPQQQARTPTFKAPTDTQQYRLLPRRCASYLNRVGRSFELDHYPAAHSVGLSARSGSGRGVRIPPGAPQNSRQS